MESSRLPELVLQSLQQERCGVDLYRAAIKCAARGDLREEWTRYLAQTEKHAEALTQLCARLGIDPHVLTPGCKILQELGAALVRAMETALAAGNPQVAQIVACECIVLAETRDLANWELIGLAAKGMSGAKAAALLEVYERIQHEEDDHLYHAQGWSRELWAESLGLSAVLPPPEQATGDTQASDAATRSSPPTNFCQP